MSRIGFNREPPTRYEEMVENRLKRREAIAQAQAQMDATRSAMVSHINSVAAGQVQLGEMILRSKVNKSA